MTPYIGQPVTFYADYRDGMAHPEAAIVVAVMGEERVNLVHWSAAGVQSARHDVTQSREACPGCWTPLPSHVLVDPEEYIANRVRAELSRHLGEPKKAGAR